VGDLAAAMGRPPVAVSGVPWPVLRAVGLVVPMMGEVAAMRHQFDQEFLIDATETTETFGLTATPWNEVVGATVGAVPMTA
jgi:hypothetical protein